MLHDLHSSLAPSAVSRRGVSLDVELRIGGFDHQQEPVVGRAREVRVVEDGW